MDARWIRFGEIEVEGRRYDHDVVIEAGVVGKRRKKASKTRRAAHGHTPLTAAEHLPLGGSRLFVGTGEAGALPVAPDVYAAAADRDVQVVAVPTPEAVRLLRKVPRHDVHAVLHVTC